MYNAGSSRRGVHDYRPPGVYGLQHGAGFASFLLMKLIFQRVLAAAALAGGGSLFAPGQHPSHAQFEQTPAADGIRYEPLPITAGPVRAQKAVPIEGAALKGIERRASRYGHGRHGHYQYEYKADRK